MHNLNEKIYVYKITINQHGMMFWNYGTVVGPHYFTKFPSHCFNFEIAECYFPFVDVDMNGITAVLVLNSQFSLAD